MKRALNKYFMICCLFLSILAFPMSIKAATISISNPGTLRPGQSVNITISTPGYVGAMIYLTPNNCTLSKTSVMIVSGSETITVTAGSAGSASITASGEEFTADGLNIAENSGSGGISFTVASPSTGGNSGGGNTQPTQPTAPEKDDRSTNNNLASLSISEGKLTPDFKADVTEYKVSLSAKTTKIKVDAKAADAKATVSGIGEKEVKPGENAITVTVKAENGATKNYVINAHVDEKPEVYLTYDNAKLGVVRNLSGVTAPSGFEESKVSIGGKEVKSWINNRMNKTIIYLIDEKSGEKNFYIYDTKTRKVGSVLKPTAILGNTVYIVDIDKKDQSFEGLTYKKIKVDNTELMGWEFNDKEFKNYSLIYVMDENGKMQYYQYEKTQNTLQKYSGAAPVSQASYDEMSKDLDSANTMKLIFMILSGVFAVTTIVGGVLAMKLRSKIK